VSAKIDELKEKIEADNTRSMKMAYAMSMRIRPVDYASQIVEIDKQIKPLKEQSGICPAGDECPLGLPIRAQISFLEEEKTKRQALAQEQEKTLIEQERAVSELSVPLVTLGDREAHKTYVELSKKKDDLMKDIDVTEIVLSGINVEKLSSETLALAVESEKLTKDLQEEETKMRSLLVIENGYSPILAAGEISRLNGQSAVLSRDLVLAQGDIRTAQDATVELLGISEQLKKLELTNSSVTENIKALTALKESFGQKGIPAVVVDYMVPKLEESINAILSQLSDFRMRIDTQRKNSSGDGIVEGLFLTIYNESGEEFDFDSYSGGQKLKITVAISEALAGLQKVGFRIMDETFTALDEDSTDEFVEVMEKLQAQFKQIICITHLRNVKDLFSEKITVTRTDGLSKIN
jgi:DNA repair exonuclease SbcCD ATPase subunit